MRAFTILTLLALGACAPKPEPAPAAVSPKATVSDFSKPMDARGTEPFWALSIRGTTLTLTRPEHPTLTGIAPGVVIQPNQAAWTGKAPGGGDLKITLYASPCSDGMSDRVYPYSAEVEVAGETPLSGCADTTAALAKGAKP